MKETRKIPPSVIPLTEAQQIEFQGLVNYVERNLNEMPYPQLDRVIDSHVRDALSRSFGWSAVQPILKILEQGNYGCRVWAVELGLLTGIHLNPPLSDTHAEYEDDYYPQFESLRVAWIQWGRENGFLEKQMDFGLL